MFFYERKNPFRNGRRRRHFVVLRRRAESFRVAWWSKHCDHKRDARNPHTCAAMGIEWRCSSATVDTTEEKETSKFARRKETVLHWRKRRWCSRWFSPLASSDKVENYQLKRKIPFDSRKEKTLARWRTRENQFRTVFRYVRRLGGAAVDEFAVILELFQQLNQRGEKCRTDATTLYSMLTFRIDSQFFHR